MKIAIDWPRETRYSLTAAMEVAWFTPWYLALLPETARLPPLRSAMGLLVLTLVPLYLIRFMDYLRLRLRVQRIIMVGVLLLTVVLATRLILYAGQDYQATGWLQSSIEDSLDLYKLIPDWMVIFLATLFLWWRGISIGQREVSVRAVRVGFFLGLVFFVVFVLAVTIVTGEDPAPFVPAFFFCGLMAMGASRAEQIRSSRGAIQAEFGPVWMIYLTLASTAVVMLGALLAVLITGGGPEELQAWLGPLTAVVGFVLILLALPIVLLLGAALALAQFLGELIGRLANEAGWGLDKNPFQVVYEFLSNLFKLPESESGSPPAFLGPLKLILALLVLASLTLGVLFLLRRLERYRGVRGGERRESIFKPEMLLKGLQHMLQEGRRRLVEMADLSRLGVRRLFAALTIRRIYAQMTRLAAEAGYPRAPSQTPYEYQATLGQVMPGCVGEIGVVTAAYVAIHYGELPETQEELARVRASWHTIKAELESKRA